MFSAYTTDGDSPSIDYLEESEREVDPTWLPPLFGTTAAPLVGIDLSAQFETEKVIDIYDDSEGSYYYSVNEETLASGTTSSHRIDDSSGLQYFDINTLCATTSPDFFSVPSSALSSLPSYYLPMPSLSPTITSASSDSTLQSPGPSSPPASSTPLQPLLPSSPPIAWPLFDPASSPLAPPAPTNSPATSCQSPSPPPVELNHRPDATCPPQRTENSSYSFVGLEPLHGEVQKGEKTKPKGGKKQQGPKPRSKPEAKSSRKGRRESVVQACKQNWEALLQGTQLKDETMLKGKWYWHLRAEKARLQVTATTIPATTTTATVDQADDGALQTTPASRVSVLPARSRLGSLYRWIQQSQGDNT